MSETFIKIDPLSQKCCLISHFASWKFWCSFFLAIFLQTSSYRNGYPGDIFELPELH